MAGSVRVLMLTDLEGSTRLWAEHPAVMVDVMAEHLALVAGHRDVPGLHLAVDYDLDGLLTRAVAMAGPIDPDAGPLLLPPW